MARDTTERNVRRDRGLREGTRDVQLQTTRRFYTARGNDQATRQAAALSNALGMGIEFYEDHLGRQNVKGEARAAQEAAAGGDRNVEDENKGYNEVFDRVEAANDLSIFASELPELLDSEGWRDLSEDEAQARIDQYYSEQLTGINPDSVYGKLVAEGILKQNAELLDVHRAYKSEQGKAERRQMVMNAARTSYETDGVLDHDRMMKDLETLVPGPGGRSAYLESAFQMAEDYGDPDIVSSIPPRFPNGDPTGIEDPKLKPLFDDALAKAQAVKNQKLKAADEAYQTAYKGQLALQHSQDKVMADAGDERVLPDIFEGGRRGPPTEQFPDGTPPRYSEAQQTALFDRYFNAREKGTNSNFLAAEYGEGNAIGYTQTELDEAHNAYVDKLIENKPEGTSDEDWQNTVRYMSIERAVDNGKLPSVYKAQLGVSTAQPQKFKQAAELYDQLNAIQPGFAETQIGARQSRLLDSYDRMLSETGGNEQQAIEMLSAYDPGLSSKVNKEVGAAVETAVTSLRNQKGGWGDYNTNPQLVRSVDEEVRFYVNMGFDPEVAAQFAVEHMTKRYVRVGDYMYAKDVGWGSEPAVTHDWILENEAAHRGVDKDTLSIVPAADPRYILINSKDAILPSTKPLRVETLSQDASKQRNEALTQRLELMESSSTDRLAEAEERAYRDQYPYNPWVESGERGAFEKMQRERWANMDPDKKKRLIAKQLKP